MDREQLAEYIFGFMPVLHRKLLKRRPKCVLPRQMMNVLHNINCHDGMPMKFYGKEMSISKPNMSKIVNDLMEKEYLTRGQDASDRRVITLNITDKGRETVKEHYDDLKSQIIESTQALSDEEIKALLDSFETIKKIFDKLEDHQKEHEENK